MYVIPSVVEGSHTMQDEKQYCVYIMMNKWNMTSYIGVTSRLAGRVWQHREKLVRGFTEKYQLNKLVYYEVFETAYDAINREKQLKRWSRVKKLELIEKKNPDLHDLSEEVGLRFLHSPRGSVEMTGGEDQARSRSR